MMPVLGGRRIGQGHQIYRIPCRRHFPLLVATVVSSVQACTLTEPKVKAWEQRRQKWGLQSRVLGERRPTPKI